MIFNETIVFGNESVIFGNETKKKSRAAVFNRRF